MDTVAADKDLIHRLKALMRIFAAIAVISGLVALFDRIDHAGWIPHSGKANVKFPNRAWEVGEYVMCSAIELSNHETHLDCTDDASDSGTVREMDVTLRGQISAARPIFIKCQRTTESISCHLA